MGEVVHTHFPVLINFVIFPDKLVQAIYFDTACFVEKALLKALKLHLRVDLQMLPLSVVESSDRHSRPVIGGGRGLGKRDKQTNETRTFSASAGMRHEIAVTHSDPINSSAARGSLNFKMKR